MGDRVRVQFPVRDISRYVTSHLGQLSLAILSWVRTISTGQRSVTPCGWGVKADMVRVWVTGRTKTVIHCYTRAVSVRFRKKAYNKAHLF